MTTLREEKGEHLFLCFQRSTPKLAQDYQLIWGSMSMSVHYKCVVSYNKIVFKDPTTVLLVDVLPPEMNHLAMQSQN